jgi:hypothetical protein
MRQNLFLLLIIMTVSWPATAQRTISGYVQNKAGEPIPASIQIAGTTKGTMAQAETGFFMYAS